MHPSRQLGSLSAFVRRQQLRALGGLLAVSLLLAVANRLLHGAGLDPGTPDRYFPLSESGGPALHVSGVPWLVGFGAALAWAWRRGASWGPARAWAAGTLLIVLGNLGQGGFDAAFQAPFYNHDVPAEHLVDHPEAQQYYHEAMGIESAGEWLAGFNASQGARHAHSTVHPPFAVLLHHAVMELEGTRLLLLPALMLLLASLALPLLGAALSEAGVDVERGSLIVLLLASTPAFNVYAGVSLDGVVAATSTLFLLGLVRVLRTPRLEVVGTACVCAGILATNALTFAGSWHCCVGLLAGLWEWRRRGSTRVLRAMGVALVLGGASIVLLRAAAGYDHVAAFRTAALLENPEGFRGWSAPLRYVMTRVEAVGEMAVFLSLGTTAMLVHSFPSWVAAFRQGRVESVLAVLALASTAAVFLSGAYQTGETARGCLYLYPFLLLLLAGREQQQLRDLLLWAGCQTALMQLLGDFFW